MDPVSISSSLLMMRTEQTQLSLSTTMMKQAAAQQNQMANILAQIPQQSPTAAAGSDSAFNFSTYA